MPLVLTCDCGARFEVDDLLAGQDVTCPECLQLLRATARGKTSPRVSWLALFSLALALAGALTVVGAAAAAVLGAVALARIVRHRDRLSGQGYALAGIGLGFASTVLTLLLLTHPDHLPVGAWLRRRTFSGQLDATGPPQVSSRDGVCLLTRPSGEWGQVRSTTSGDPAVDDLQGKRDALLASPRWHAFADITLDGTSNPVPLSVYSMTLAESLQPPRPPLIGEYDKDNAPKVGSVTVHKDRGVEPIDDHEGHEWLIDVSRGGQTWRFLIRVYRKKRTAAARPGPLYILRAYAPRRLFLAGEEELRQLLDSVRFSP